MIDPGDGVIEYWGGGVMERRRLASRIYHLPFVICHLSCFTFHI
jgi:hypothetical protein